MKITTVHYSALVNTGNYENEKVGLDAQLEEGDTVVSVVEALKEQVFAQLDRTDLLQERRELKYEIAQLEEKIQEARQMWERTAEFLKAQGLRPDAPEFPAIKGLLTAPSERRIVAEVVDDSP